jgi:TnpA family transposase
MVMLEKHAWLVELGVDQWALQEVHPNRVRYLARLGRTARPQMIRRMPEQRRYPVLVAFTRQALVDITDTLMAMFDQCLAELHAKAKRERRDSELGRAGLKDEVVEAFASLAVVLLDDDTVAPDAVRPSIFECVPREEIERLLSLCKGDARPFDSASLEFLLSRYGHIKKFSEKFFKQMGVRADGNEQLEDALKALKIAHEHGRGPLPADSPMSFVSPQWERHVVTAHGLDRGYYEVCALMKVREGLRSGEAWVANSDLHAPVASYVLPKDKWVHVRKSAYQLLDAPSDAQEALARKTAALRSQASALRGAVDAGDVGILVTKGAGRLRLSPLEARASNERLEDLRLRVRSRMPEVELFEMIAEVDRWTQFSERLVHQTDGAPARGTKLHHLYAAILGQACNIGFTSMARSTRSTFNQLVWAASWHLREETLRGAFSAVADFQHRQPLCRLWGGTGLSSSDGQRFPVRRRTTVARALPKYFNQGRGVTFYTTLDDRYAQFGVKMIPATAREATFVLDGLLDNETDIEVLEHATDTHGYTDLVFALFDLLGYRFAPRLKGIGNWRLFDLRGGLIELPDGLKVDGHIDPEGIIEQWDEMMRIAASLKLGHVSASVLIGKLQAATKQTAVARALVEYGRLCKTEHILRYASDEAFRRRILLQLNKGEAVQGVRRFIMFGEAGGLLGRDQEALTNQAASLNLVSNIAMVWTTVYLARVIDTLRAEGVEVRDEDVARLSPARFEHIERFGKYRLDELPQKGQFRALGGAEN